MEKINGYNVYDNFGDIPEGVNRVRLIETDELSLLNGPSDTPYPIFKLDYDCVNAFDNVTGSTSEAWNFMPELIEAAERFRRDFVNAGDVLIRWLSIFHGANVLDDRERSGFVTFSMPGDEGVWGEPTLYEVKAIEAGDIYMFTEMERIRVWETAENLANGRIEQSSGTRWERGGHSVAGFIGEVKDVVRDMAEDEIDMAFVLDVNVFA